METNKHLHFKPSKLFVLYIALFVQVLSSCNYPGERGPVWLSDPFVTTTVDVANESGNKSDIFNYGTATVYCHLSIRGPENFKIFVRWYYENELVVEEFVDLGIERRAAPPLNFSNGEPLPVGSYRCDYGIDADKPLRSIRFSIQ